MKVLVWQWGRYGAGPRIAVELARGLARLPDVSVVLSLSHEAEIMGHLPAELPPGCVLPVRTYRSKAGYLGRLVGSPAMTLAIVRRLRGLRCDLAICAMPGPLDLVMQGALRLCGVANVVVVHDAQAHPGDGFPLQMTLQRLLVRGSDAVVTFSRYIAGMLHEQGVSRPVIVERLPPLGFDRPPPPPGGHDGPLRLLSFGRLLPYKGLDLLLEAMRTLGPRGDLELRVVGSGPPSPELEALAGLPGVSVENRWVPEDEVPSLIGWSDALVLPYREASQSGVAAMAVAGRRLVVATDVGGLSEQFDPGMAVICHPEGGAIAAGIETLLARRADGTLAASAATDGWPELAGRLLDAIEHSLPQVATRARREASPVTASRAAS